MERKSLKGLAVILSLLGMCYGNAHMAEATEFQNTMLPTQSTAITTQTAADRTSTASTEAAIQVPVELNYAKGIKDGIYGWTLSEDGIYYMLSAIDKDGKIVPSKAKKSFGPRGNKSSQKAVQNEAAVMMQQTAAENIDPLAMERNMQASQQTVNAQGVYTERNITNVEYQTMLVFVPAPYLTIHADGSASFTTKVVNGYTAQTAPIVFQNNNMGWRSGSPSAPEYVDALNAGMIYVSCGSRSRDALDANNVHTGKMPTPVADLKAGVIALRANSDVIPGDKNKIISVGASGGGQMSSALGATGNMEQYLPELYKAGAIGVQYDAVAKQYHSQYKDDIFAAMCYCPIGDIEDADMAYMWFRYDSTLDSDGKPTSTVGSYSFTPFQLALQKDAAQAFPAYINSLHLTDAAGNPLTFEADKNGKLNPRKGSYYDATLTNISKALNAYVKANYPEESKAQEYFIKTYGDTSSWLKQNEDGSYSVTNLAEFIARTNLTRNKDIPGFDTLDLSAENNAFGIPTIDAVHYSPSIAKLLKQNYDAYSQLEGFDKEQVDAYISNALDGAEAACIAEQTYLVNATKIMLNVAAGKESADIAKHWRTRNGTADEHTSFSIAYNICQAAELAGADADYSLVWAMNHGSNEGTTTGTFVDWINQICK